MTAHPSPPDFIKLKEKIAISADFTPAERDLILDALNLGDYAGQHTYPSRHGPGSDKWATLAWSILDQFSPDAIPVRVRFLLGGMIAGAFNETFEMRRKGK